ncbi:MULTISPECIES: hypothetical protein [unclassified Chitinophaga]|uniref:hypothetical protein n=1 Tax=unclassified Chitinophaga TaxID=2619133 RepID=UPI0009D0C33A|nr:MULTISPECIES: hypothetical protein [unclassified Chitinophaga]OMP76128.1 hypothetical protein BW716_26415 [[Flexibacter] sp. ATCC 35208]WPV65338.1 hypothetical protein QQL36_26405 [Chitinophaga sp. LS1]
MMKRYLLIAMLAVLACNQTTQQAATGTDSIPAPPIAADSTNVDEAEDYPHETTTDSSKISGDFNGDGKTEDVWAIITKAGHGNPVENGVADELGLQFSDPALPPVKIGCCEVRLFNEGDLDHDGAEELTVYQAPENGNVYQMYTYTFKNNAWVLLYDPFLIPTGGDYLSDKELQDRVVMENDTIFYYDVDLNSEKQELVKKQVMLNN